ncbi:MAG: YmaF family protein [Oscillospiraceae bacterium]|nr:YmaF family protein [Oscillospiraceae bacterium]
MDEEMIGRLINREYPSLARNSAARNRRECRECHEEEFCPASNLPQQSHDHEFTASTFFAESCESCVNRLRHNHRFSGVTSEAIPLSCDDHKHAIFINTDSYGHHHEVGVETGPAIDVGHGKHIHFVCGETTLDDFHVHGFQFVTAIQNPLIRERCREKEECDCDCDFECKCKRRYINRCENKCETRY